MQANVKGTRSKNSVKGILSLLALALASTTCLSATPIVSVNGPAGPDDSLSIYSGLVVSSGQWLALSFSVGHAYSNVTISADLTGNFTGNAYLTTQIGAGTTAANEVTSGSFNSAEGFSSAYLPVLSNIALPGAGTYFLVLSTTNTAPANALITTKTPVVTADSGAANGTLFIAFALASYAPASNFFDYNVTFDPDAFGMYKVETNAAATTPEPATGVLFSGAIGLVFLVKRLKRA